MTSLSVSLEHKDSQCRDDKYTDTCATLKWIIFYSKCIDQYTTLEIIKFFVNKALYIKLEKLYKAQK